MRHAVCLLFAGCLLLFVPVRAHVGEHPSVHDTVAQILTRLGRTLPHAELDGLNQTSLLKLLTAEEQHVLATGHTTFEIDRPAEVHLLYDAKEFEEPVWWLEAAGFRKTGQRAEFDGDPMDIWHKRLPAGEVGLGVNSLYGGGEHYVILLTPAEGTAPVQVTHCYPALKVVAPARSGKIEVETPSRVVSTQLALPPELEGAVLLAEVRDRDDDAKLIKAIRATPYAATARPDQIVLTWSGDPRHSQTIQWRTSTSTTLGRVQYQLESAFTPQAPNYLEARAETRAIRFPDIANDPVNHRHTAELTQLQPGQRYIYRVGDGREAHWTEPRHFTTAPAGPRPFSFVYMGDAQNGLDRWGDLIQAAHRRTPQAAFYIMAGDLVDRGAERDDWDAFFHFAGDVFSERTLAPVLGNHEYHTSPFFSEPLYLDLFTLPAHPPLPERCYAFEYGNAQFVMLDSNKPNDAAQLQWLDQTLGRSQATWKFVVYHHPAFSSLATRDNAELRQKWGAIFDKHHVDVALQGHDHAYLRTWPMKAGKRTTEGNGTVYIVSVAGTKYYEQGTYDYTAVGFRNTSTYQVLDIKIVGDELRYRAFDLQGQVLDEFTLRKDRAGVAAGHQPTE